MSATRESFQARSFSSYLSPRMVAAIGGVVLVFLVLEGTSAGRLFTSANIGSLLDSSSEVGFITIGVTALMIGGEFDLSVGQSFVAGGMAFASLFSLIGMVPALIVGLLIGAMIGMVNGAVTLSLRIPSFITTLGTYYIVAGGVLLATGGTPISPTSTPSSFSVFASYIFGSSVRWEVVWWVGLATIFAVVLHRTSFGNHIFAVGGEPGVARGVGVQVPRTKMILFVLSGTFASLGGIISFMHLGTMAPSAGSGLQLEAIAAAVIGGTSLFGGVGTIMGGALGALFLGVIDVGLVLSGASALYYELYVGVVVILAVAVQVRTEGAAATLRRLRNMAGGRRGRSGDVLAGTGPR